MQFIVDNYIWFIVGGVVLLMAIIGYFADRTDFGRKEFQKRLKEPKEKNKDSKKETSKKGKVEEVIKEEVPIKIPDDALVDDVVNEENDNLITEDLFQVLPTETTHESIAIDNDEDLYKPLQSNDEYFETPLESEQQVNNNEDLYQPLQSDEQQINNSEDLYQPLQSDEQVSYSDDLFSPLGDVSNPASNEVDNNGFVQSDDMNNQVDSEEDVWKF